MLIKHEEELEIYLISRLVQGIHIRKILSDTTLAMLERTTYLFIILLLLQYRFQNH